MGRATLERFSLLRVGALGLCYLAQQVSWALYNAYLPLLYGRLVASDAAIGLVMVVDNVAALTVQPHFAAMSDRVQTRLGRRRPFVLAGMPLAALGMALIPRAPRLPAMVLATLAMNLGVALFAGPSLALLPDVTPPPYRSRANGIVMAMGGVGALLAFFLLSPLYRVRPSLPFDAAALLLLLSLVLLLALVREGGPAGAPAAGGIPAAARRGAAPAGGLADWSALAAAVRWCAAGPDRAPLRLLLAGAGWVGAVNGVQNMFTRYGVERLGLDAVGATFLLGFVALSFIVCSVPAGLAGERWGRWRVMRWGTAGLLAVFALLPWITDPRAIRVLFLFGGAAYAAIISNAYPALVDRVPPERVGAFTGLWNTAVAAGGLTPPLFGWAADAWGYGAFFLPGVALLAVAAACVFGAPAGDAGRERAGAGPGEVRGGGSRAARR